MLPSKGAFLLFYAIDLLVDHSVFSKDCLISCSLEILAEQERVQCHLRGWDSLYPKRIKEFTSFLSVFCYEPVIRCHAVQGFAWIAVEIQEYQIYDRMSFIFLMSSSDGWMPVRESLSVDSYPVCAAEEI